jgi:hypothetical protein
MEEPRDVLDVEGGRASGAYLTAKRVQGENDGDGVQDENARGQQIAGEKYQSLQPLHKDHAKKHAQASSKNEQQSAEAASVGLQGEKSRVNGESQSGEPNGTGSHQQTQIATKQTNSEQPGNPKQDSTPGREASITAPAPAARHPRAIPAGRSTITPGGGTSSDSPWSGGFEGPGGGLEDYTRGSDLVMPPMPDAAEPREPPKNLSDWDRNGIHIGAAPGVHNMSGYATPKIIHMVWVSKQLNGTNTAPTYVKENLRKWRKAMRDWQTVLWTNDDVRKHFPELSETLLTQVLVCRCDVRMFVCVSL